MRVEVELTGSPSTGYDWQSDREPDDVRYKERYPSQDDELRFGGQNLTTFIFNDVQPWTTLTFGYKRPWEKEFDSEQLVHVRIKSHSRWDRFLNWVTINNFCEDIVIPGYGGEGVSYVEPGCGHSGRVHNRGGCEKCNCTRGFDSPVA